MPSHLRRYDASLAKQAVHRDHAWDLRMTPAVREFVTFIGDERRRALVTRVLDAFDSAVLPCNSWLPRAVIMGDFNGMCGNQHFLALSLPVIILPSAVRCLVRRCKCDLSSIVYSREPRRRWCHRFRGLRTHVARE